MHVMGWSSVVSMLLDALLLLSPDLLPTVSQVTLHNASATERQLRGKGHPRVSAALLKCPLYERYSAADLLWL